MPRRASLCAWNIFTLFIFDCQYFTYPAWSPVIIQLSLWLQTIVRTGLSWACNKYHFLTFKMNHKNVVHDIKSIGQVRVLLSACQISLLFHNTNISSISSALRNFHRNHNKSIYPRGRRLQQHQKLLQNKLISLCDLQYQKWYVRQVSSSQSLILDSKMISNRTYVTSR